MRFGNIEYGNPSYPEAFGNYMITNGYQCTASPNGMQLTFIKDHKKLVVYKNSIDFFDTTPKPGTDTDQFDFVCGFVGLSGMTLDRYMGLMHGMGVVRKADFDQVLDNVLERFRTF